MYHTCVTFQYKIYKNNKSIDLRIVNSTNVKISKTIQICYFLCSQDYNEFWIETLHDCGIHNYLQPDFFLNFLELRNSDFSFFKRAICSPSYNVSFRTPHSLKRTVLHFCLEWSCYGRFWRKVQILPFLTMRSVLENISQNSNGTWQRHKWTVCFVKRQKKL
jgi:hypothetical protein